MGATVGVFVGIIVNRVEYDKYLVGWLWRCYTPLVSIHNDMNDTLS